MSAPAAADPPKPAGYDWPEADEAEVMAACARVARHLTRAGVRSVGVLPVVGGPHWWSILMSGGTPTIDLQPILERLATSMVSFVGGTVGFIGPWRSWGNEDRKNGQEALRIRGVREQVVEIVPPPCADGGAATSVLRRCLASLPPEISRVLVDLGGYAAAGRLPAAASAVDGLVAAVAARRARQAWVTSLKNKIPADKSLGAILIG
jgi:hypothetical protein